MQPAVAAHTLSKVESEWRSQALLFAECKANGLSDCGRAQNIFQKSCSTVVSAVVAASSGDVDTVKEYMGVVCAEPELKGWKQDRCQNFAKAISQTMTADNYANREYLNTQGLCTSFWSGMSSEEGARAAQERAQEAKRIEAEHALVAKRAKEAAEALAAAKKAKMEAEAKRQAEEQHRRQAAEKAAQEAKVAAERKAAAERKPAAEAQAAQAKKAAEKLCKDLAKLGAEPALLASGPEVLTKSPEERKGFDVPVLDSLKGVLTQQVARVDADIATNEAAAGELGREAAERAEAAQLASSKRDAAARELERAEAGRDEKVSAKSTLEASIGSTRREQEGMAEGAKAAQEEVSQFSEVLEALDFLAKLSSAPPPEEAEAEAPEKPEEQPEA